MSRFTPLVKYEADFDGDHLVFELRRLKIKHRAMIVRATDKAPAPGEREALLAETGQAVLPDCVVSMSGLTVEGKPVTDINIVLEEAYFLPLVDQLLAVLIRTSRAQEEDIKNSDGLPDDTSKV